MMALFATAGGKHRVPSDPRAEGSVICGLWGSNLTAPLLAPEAHGVESRW